MNNLYYIVFEKYQSNQLTGKASCELLLNESEEYIVSEIRDKILYKLEKERSYGETIPEIIITNIINLTKLVA